MISEEQKAALIRDYHIGMSLNGCAQKYGVEYLEVRGWVNHLWKDVDETRNDASYLQGVVIGID